MVYSQHLSTSINIAQHLLIFKYNHNNYLSQQLVSVILDC